MVAGCSEMMAAAMELVKLAKVNAMALGAGEAVQRLFEA